ncbi:hypothetical protein PJI21_19165 [Mycobacterium kansasii]|uniref:Uncharacterized protein n=2 Tax=Mycobacterium TaxID=1763 RepID=A0A1A3NLE2_MYCAS|nr:MULTISPECIES: hypothetical protein [Mycobacterium]MBI2697980.1 hypothetical protein [Mycobacterium sp.]AYE98120.1 hypothetical protein C0J29_28330 [Mycobacterium paragordonae]MDP7725751.1 hypothetical protein [Mycobacterium sp. TY814]MDP7739164.1 hypothetical protein [Mycobacterium paragordonae]OBI90837.1 hypothetical protein A9X01_10920 [Mycobacterium asiaticum]
MVNHLQRRELIRRQIQGPTAATSPKRRLATATGRTGAAVARAAKRLLPGVALVEEVRHVRHDLAKLGHARVATTGDRVRPRHYPPRSCSYLDDELMNREMSD